MPNPSAGDTVIPTKTSSTTIDETSDRDVQQRPARTESNPVARKRQLEPLSTKTEVPRKNPRHGELVQEFGRINDKLAGRTSKTGNASPMRIRGGSSLQMTTSLTSSHAGKLVTRISKKPELEGIGITETSENDKELLAASGQRETQESLELNGSSSSSTMENALAVAVVVVVEEKERIADLPRLESEVLLEAEVTSASKESVLKTRQRSSHDPKALKRPPEDLPCGQKISEGSVQDDVSKNAFALAKRIKQSSASNEEQGPVRVSDEERKELDGTKLVRKLNAKAEDSLVRPDKVPRKDDSLRLRRTIQWLEEGARRMREDLAATRAELHEERRAARLAKREFDAAVREARSVEIVKHQAIISELKTRLSQSPVSAVESSSASAKAEHLKDENHRRELSAVKKRLAEAEATIRKLKLNSLEPCNTGKRRKINDADTRKVEAEIQNLRATNKKLEEKLHTALDAERCRTAELRVQHENHEAELASLQRTLRSDTIKMMDEMRGKCKEIEKLEKLLAEGLQMHKKLQSKEDDLMRKLRESERNHQFRLAPRIEENITNGDHAVVDLCKGECDAVAEVERLRELVVEQQEVIEVLRQAVKEKERKLDQLTNKKRKEEFYKQWLELEPVAEVDDEEEHEEGDSALSSAPSSLSPQPGGCAQWQAIAITREAYETVLLEVEELQIKLLEEQRELTHAKSQVRDLEKALLQETRGSQNSRRALSDKLREAEEQEASLLAEISELREQNELLEFRVLELEETPCPRDTPDPADSGIVSPEPIHLYKDQLNKHRDRAVATVIPYNTYIYPVSPIPQKPPLSLQESGIFEEEEDAEVELASRGTQTEAPAGELLQEVQRLHELRARIQERAAVKVPVPVVDAKTCSSLEVSDAADVTIYQERIRDLEERLGSYREAEEKRLQDQQLSKQREEELLDENYKLAERIYWFENELRSLKDAEKRDDVVESTMLPVAEEKGTGARGIFEKEDNAIVKNVVDDDQVLNEVLDKDRSEDSKDDSISSQCQMIFDDVMKSLQSDNCVESNDEDYPRLETDAVHKSLVGMIQPSCTKGECSNLWADCNAKLQQLACAERCMRNQIVDLERRERAFVKTLQQADSMWLRMESDYASQLEDLRGQLSEKIDVNRGLIDRLASTEENIRAKYQDQCSFCHRHLLRETKEDPKRCVDEVDCIENIEYNEDNIGVTTDLNMEVDQDTGEHAEDSLKLVAAPVKMNRESLLEGKQCAVTTKKIMVGESAEVSFKRSEVTKATQTDEFAVATNCRCSVNNNNNQCNVPLSMQTVVSDAKGDSTFINCQNELTSHRDVALNPHGRITADVPLGFAAEEVPEIAAEATEETFERETLVDVSGAVSQVRIIAEEEHAAETEAVVTFTESEPEKKVRQRRNGNREREGWAMRAWNAKSRLSSFRQDISTDQTHRLILYPEICV